MPQDLLISEEVCWIQEHQERCEQCLHLLIFHRMDFDDLGETSQDCEVDDCDCHS